MQLLGLLVVIHLLGFTGAITESWNGTNWTEVADLNTASKRTWIQVTGSATTSALAFGGNIGPTKYICKAITESWNGS